MSSNQRSIFLKDSQSAAMSSLTSHLYAFGEFRVDVQNRVLRKNEEPIPLTPKAFEVLLLLIQHSGEVVSKDELIQRVWPDSFVEESNLTQTVFMLRKALGESSVQRYILTVQGKGYRFVPEVKTVPVNEHVPDTISHAATQGTGPGEPVVNWRAARDLPHDSYSLQANTQETSGDCARIERGWHRRRIDRALRAAGASHGAIDSR